MPDHPPPSSQHTFIVRFWWEWQEAGLDRTRGWRGRVDHVQSGEGMTFKDLRQLLTFIKGFINPLQSPPFDQAGK